METATLIFPFYLIRKGILLLLNWIKINTGKYPSSLTREERVSEPDTWLAKMGNTFRFQTFLWFWIQSSSTALLQLKIFFILIAYWFFFVSHSVFIDHLSYPIIWYMTILYPSELKCVTSDSITNEFIAFLRHRYLLSKQVLYPVSSQLLKYHPNVVYLLLLIPISMWVNYFCLILTKIYFLTNWSAFLLLDRESLLSDTLV